MTAERGIIAAGFFILGFPNETAQEVSITVDYALKSDLHIASFFYLCPFSGTPLVKLYPELEEKVKNMNFSDYSTINVNMSALSDKEMKNICKHAYRKFYFNAVRISRIMKVIPKNVRALTSAIDISKLAIKNAVNY